MEIFDEIEPLRTYLSEKRRNHISIGLVPTMGALHEGHLSLIRASKADNDLTIATIYVNPTQFNNSKDLENYPKSLEGDITLLQGEKCDVLFQPSDEEMYGMTRHLKFEFGHLDNTLEGKFRPGHFSGVALVVSKLFNIVNPDRAYFGQKDYQQFKIIEQLNNELKFFVDLRSVPIAREPSGLALSSRNQRLSTEGKRDALLLVESLDFIRTEINKGEEFRKLKTRIKSLFKKRDNMNLEYLELADKHTLKLIDQPNNPQDAILLIAAFVDDVRLIDNMMVGEANEN